MTKIAREGRFFVYIVECQDGTYYTGCTPDINKRIKLHNQGKASRYTRGRGPVNLLWSERHLSWNKACSREYRIKKLTRKQKERLVEGRQQ